MNEYSNDSNNMKKLNIQKLLSAFTIRQAAYSRQVTELLNGSYRDSGKCFYCSINAVESVIIPLLNALKEHFPQLQLPDKDRYGLSGGYYKITIGNRVVGGFAFPKKGRDFLLYTPFTENPGYKADYKITSLSQLVRIIRKQLNFKVS